MNLQSKKITTFILLTLSLSICTPAIYAADEPQITQEQPQSEPEVTDEQIRKDWPQVMRMVNRLNAQHDREEEIKNSWRGKIGPVILTVLVCGFAFSQLFQIGISRARP